MLNSHFHVIARRYYIAFIVFIDYLHATIVMFQ